MRVGGRAHEREREGGGRLGGLLSDRGGSGRLNNRSSNVPEGDTISQRSSLGLEEGWTRGEDGVRTSGRISNKGRPPVGGLATTFAFFAVAFPGVLASRAASLSIPVQRYEERERGQMGSKRGESIRHQSTSPPLCVARPPASLGTTALKRQRTHALFFIAWSKLCSQL